ncbi:MAG: hypothetical protein Q8Q52_00100, partial [Acidimicrobiia bacterium]|nr:hypothetical protein [Acidimicrobiia bacterium]
MAVILAYGVAYLPVAALFYAGSLRLRRGRGRRRVLQQQRQLDPAGTEQPQRRYLRPPQGHHSGHQGCQRCRQCPAPEPDVMESIYDEIKDFVRAQVEGFSDFVNDVRHDIAEPLRRSIKRDDRHR